MEEQKAPAPSRIRQKPKKVKKTGAGVRIPGTVVTLFTLASCGVFAGTMLRAAVLPAKYTLLLIAVLALFTLLVFVLTRSTQNLGRFIFGTVLAVLVCALLLYASWMINKGVSTVQEGMGTAVETSEVGVYVLTDDPAQTAEDASGYTFGILAALDRSNTDYAVAQLEQQLGTTLTIVEYDSVEDLADAIGNGEIGGIIMGEAFINLFEDIDGYTDMADRLRELGNVEITSEAANNGSDATAWTYTGAGDGEGNIATDPENADAETGDNTETTDTERETLDTIENLAELNKDPNCFILYVSGIDIAGAITNRSRSDVNIVCAVNTETKQVLLIHIPRDFYVYTPVSGDVRDKLTNAGLYGVDCSIGAVENLLNIDIDYYVRVNFNSVVKIVDALGGITVYSDQSFSVGPENVFVKGNNYVDGTKALVFARERHAVDGGDRGRGRHQMEIIKGCIRKACSPVILTNFMDIMESVEGCYQTSLPYELIASLVQEQIETGTEWELFSMSVNGEGASKKAYSQKLYTYVMVPYQDTLDKATGNINKLLTGQKLTDEDVS